MLSKSTESLPTHQKTLTNPSPKVSKTMKFPEGYIGQIKEVDTHCNNKKDI